MKHPFRACTALVLAETLFLIAASSGAAEAPATASKAEASSRGDAPKKNGERKQADRKAKQLFVRTFNDIKMAAVLTCARQSFGNDGELVSAEAVRKVREATHDRVNFQMAEELLKEHPLPAPTVPNDPSGSAALS